ncbi:hypothetical protein DXG01_001125 [Tephrocybe rancida]|nr:hypothetical protein DXG01_001125 [Tephrocybe rancida]
MRYGYPLLEAARVGIRRDSFTAYLVTSLICDMTISLSLVYFLNKLRTGFRSINVGLLTSAIAICTLITYFTIPTLVFADPSAISGSSLYHLTRADIFDD